MVVFTLKQTAEREGREIGSHYLLNSAVIHLFSPLIWALTPPCPFRLSCCVECQCFSDVIGSVKKIRERARRYAKAREGSSCSCRRMTPPDLRAPRRPRGVDQLCLTEKPRTALSSRRLRPDSVFDMEPSLFCHGATVVFGEALQVDITHRWTGFGSEPRRRSGADSSQHRCRTDNV